MGDDMGGVALLLFFKKVALAVVILGLGWYVFTRINPATGSPEIEMIYPVSDVSVAGEDLVLLSGKINKPGRIYVNGVRQETFEDFKFEYPTVLLPGRNVFSVYVVDRFGKEVLKSIDIYYEG